MLGGPPYPWPVRVYAWVFVIAPYLVARAMGCAE